MAFSVPAATAGWGWRDDGSAEVDQPEADNEASARRPNASRTTWTLAAHFRHPPRLPGGAQTNLRERSLAEVGRHTKVVGRFPGEDSCLALVWAVLDLVAIYRQRRSLQRTRPRTPSSESDTNAHRQQSPAA